MEDFTDTQVFLKFIQDRIDRSIRRNEASLNQGIYDASSSDEYVGFFCLLVLIRFF